MDTITTIPDLLKLNGFARPATVALMPSDLRLIAAAPDLLEALETVLASASPTEKDHPRMFSAWQKVLAAIAKSKGENL